jgi:hypothetical protein
LRYEKYVNQKHAARRTGDGNDQLLLKAAESVSAE